MKSKMEVLFNVGLKWLLGLTAALMATFCLCPLSAEVKPDQYVPPQPEPPQTVPWKGIENINLKGEIIDGENISFTLDFEVEFTEKGRLPLVLGDVTEISSDIKTIGGGFLFWGGGEFRIVSDPSGYYLECVDAGKCKVTFVFASKISKRDTSRVTSLALPAAISRAVQVFSPRKDVEMNIPNALNIVKTDKEGAEGATVTAMLPPEGPFVLEWRWHVEDLKAELVASAQGMVTATVNSGTVKIGCLMNYNVIQGKLKELKISISPDLNIVNVTGKDIQDWKVEKEDAKSFLKVALSLEYEKDYGLFIEAEKILQDFPCKFSVPSVKPLNVLQYEGYLAFGTNGAIKLIVDSFAGLSQIDNVAFPKTAPLNGHSLVIPAKNLFTYRFSGEEYVLQTSADNIIPSYSADLNYVASFKDEDMNIRANVSLEIKDAPLKELMVRYGEGVMITRVEGTRVAPEDYELIEKDGAKWIKIPFLPDTIGRTELFINMEKNMGGSRDVKIPGFHIENAKSVRGFLILAAARGLVVNVTSVKELRKANVGSSPLKEPGLQQVFRLKRQDWECAVNIQHEKATVVSEVFNICSVGEGSIFGSSAFTYHIGGAPVDKIIFSLNKACRNIEFTGANIVDWKKTGDEGDNQLWQVNFRDKVFGDCNVLASYEILLSGNETSCHLGDVTTKDADSESGFLVVCSLRNLNVKVGSLSENFLVVENSEIPQEYTSMLRIPVLLAFRFANLPHSANLTISSYQSQKLLDIAVDMVNIRTTIDRNGEAVSNVQYRIKNSSRQFLTLKLPKGSDLWTVKVDGEIKRVSSAGDADPEILVPIPRKQDTNTPIAVELVYAHKFGALDISKDLAMQAPTLNIENMQTNWTVEVPQEYDMVKFGGNMTALRNPQLAGLPGFLRRTLSWISLAFGTGLFAPWFLACAGLFLFSWRYGMGKAGAFTWIMSAVILIFAFILSIALLARANIPIPPLTTINTAEFTKLFSMPNDNVTLQISMTDMKEFSFMKIIYFIIGFALSALLLIVGYTRTELIPKSFSYALSLVFFVSAGTQWLKFNALAAFIIVILIPLLITVFLCIKVFRSGKARAAAAGIAMLFMLFSPGLQADDEGIRVVSAEYSVKVTEEAAIGVADIKIDAENSGNITILKAPAVLTRTVEKDSGAEIIRSNADYLVKIKSSGKYELKIEFLMPLADLGGGKWAFHLNIPDCVKNSFVVTVDKNTLGIEAPNAVTFKKGLKDGFCELTASFSPAAQANFIVQPQIRNVEKEEVHFFASINSLASFEQGLVDVSNMISFQIPQGETAKFVFEIPANMKVTAVECAELSAWRYDPATKSIEVFLTKPVSGNFKLLIKTQISGCNLPYKADIGMIKVKDAGKEYGTLAVCCDQTVQIQVDKADSLNEINTGDCASEILLKAGAQIKKAYRYHTLPVSLQVQAVAVEPELRVMESSRISFEEERTVISSAFSIEIAKAGIFSMTFDIPDSFDIDRVAGDSIQHWDELTEGAHRLVVHFDRRVSGTVQLSMELKLDGAVKREGIMKIPKITVNGTQRLKGDLVVTSEQGVLMEVVSRNGLEVKTDSFKATGEGTVQNFSIVRPDWALEVRFDTVAPWIQVESLQTARLSEGVMESSVVMNYAIQNAGVKILKVKLPDNCEVPEFDGESIIGTQKNADGTWEVELQKKTFKDYRLKVRFRQSVEKDKNISVMPIIAAGAELQKGYVAVLSDDSLQVKVAGTKGEITDFDSRKIPQFGQEYLDKAVFCFKTVGTDYSLSLEVTRHKVAEMLKAQISSVDVTSVVSPDGRVVTKTQVILNNGNENYLKLTLPEAASVWSVLIDGQPVDAACEGNKMLVPLKQSLSGSGKEQTLEIIYSLKADSQWAKKMQVYKGPSFNLPLRKLSWNLYMSPEYDYSGYSGSLDWKDTSIMSFITSNIEEYDRINDMQQNKNIQDARGNISLANSLANAGKYNEALDAFQNASSQSTADKELNSDIQGQMLQIQRDQSMSAFYNRRSVQKKGKNMKSQSAVQYQTENHVAQAQGEAPRTVNINEIKKELGGEEIRNLQHISDKIFMQQQAAAVMPHPLNPTIPEGGTKLIFERALQIVPDAPMLLSFKADKKFNWKDFSGLTAGLILTLSMMLLFIFGFACTSIRGGRGKSI